MQKTCTETQPRSSGWSLRESKGRDLLGPTPSSASLGCSQLNGVFCYLLMADKGPHGPWQGPRRLSELCGVWEAGGGARLPHEEHPAVGSRDASFNNWKLCSPAQFRALYPPPTKTSRFLLLLVKHPCLRAGAGCLPMLAAGSGHFTTGMLSAGVVWGPRRLIPVLLGKRASLQGCAGTAWHRQPPGPGNGHACKTLTPGFCAVGFYHSCEVRMIK